MSVRNLKTPLLRALAGLAFVLLAGCSTINSRIKANPAVFDALPLETQEKVRKGIVEVGYSPDMVYIAMGRPSEKRSSRSATLEKETWIYSVHYQDWVGRAMVGYRRVVVYDEKTKRTYVYHQPVYEDFYRDRKEDRIRIEFEDGVVSAIEQRT
ncbi:MAG TPA: hypothetical protein VMM36_16150 [Opitutaceae bacterium]|nr:hypothetical protein [Opitutaceae bacterium]